MHLKHLFLRLAESPPIPLLLPLASCLLPRLNKQFKCLTAYHFSLFVSLTPFPVPER